MVGNHGNIESVRSQKAAAVFSDRLLIKIHQIADQKPDRVCPTAHQGPCRNIGFISHSAGGLRNALTRAGGHQFVIPQSTGNRGDRNSAVFRDIP